MCFYCIDPLIRHSRPSMKDLNKHVIPLVATRWYDLGLELLETKHERELDTIEKDSKVEGVKTCCRKMFSKWLETQSDDASWDQLIQAAKNIELYDLANNIEQLLLQGKYVTDMISVVVVVGGAQCGIASCNIVCSKMCWWTA